MNRKEMGYAVAGMVGAMVGAGCAFPQRSQALPAVEQDQAVVPSRIEVHIFSLALAVNYSSTFYKNEAYKVTSSNKSICRADDYGHAFLLRALAQGDCTITIEDTLTGTKSSFPVSCLKG